MSETKTLLALFQDLDPAADAIDKLHEMGLTEDQVNVISGVPVLERILGRPVQWTNVPRLAFGGSIAGFIIGLLLAFSPATYPALVVGGQPLIPVPPSIIVVFEMTMLGMLLSTFIGVFLDSSFPSYKPMEYIPEISDGKIAVFFACPADEEKKFVSAMKKLGAESVHPAEAQQL